MCSEVLLSEVFVLLMLHLYWETDRKFNVIIYVIMSKFTCIGFKSEIKYLELHIRLMCN